MRRGFGGPRGREPSRAKRFAEERKLAMKNRVEFVSERFNIETVGPNPNPARPPNRAGPNPNPARSAESGRS